MPLTDSYGQGVPYSTLTDKPNIQTMGQGIVNGLAPKSVMTFASAVVRGATITAPKPGMQTYLADIQSMQYFDGTTWQTIAATQVPPTLVDLGGAYEPWSSTSNLLTVRREGNQVYMDGRIQKVNGGTVQAGDAINVAHVPAGFAPSAHFAEGTVNISQASGKYITGRCEVRSATDPTDPGLIQVWISQPTMWLGFNMRWFIN